MPTAKEPQRKRAARTAPSPLPTLQHGPVRREVAGRRLTRRTIDVYQAEDGTEIHIEQLPEYQRPFRLEILKQHAIERLCEHGVDASAILAEHPGGSALRDHVLNHLGHAPDSKLGLAAQICEVCIRTLHFMDAGAHASKVAPLAYRLGWLIALSRLYETADGSLEATQQAGAEARRVYEEADRERWRELHAARFHGHSARRAAALIAAHLKLPKEAIETVRKALAPKKTGRPA